MNRYFILPIAVVLIVFLLFIPTGSTAKPSPASEEQNVTRLADLPQQVRGKIEHQLQTAEYEVTSCEKSLPSGETGMYRAFNRSQNMIAYFTRSGIHLLSNSEAAPCDLEMLLSEYGYENALTQVYPIRPDDIFVSGQRIEYVRNGITEWYVNDERGLEQGVVLKEPPDGKNTGSVIVTWTVSGSLKPVLEKDGVEITFRNSEDRTVINCNGLMAWDAYGRLLPATLAVEGCGPEGQQSRISYILDDTGASYPVTIDPLFSQEKKLLPKGPAQAHFGKSVSISGDTMVLGASGDNENGLFSGSAYIFYRDQGGPDAWGQVAKIIADDGDAYDWFGVSVSISGDTVVVGAQHDEDNGYHSGSAYVFYRNQGGANAWGQVAKIKADDGVDEDIFGTSVSISEDWLAVGADGDDDNGDGSGSVYIFYRDQGGFDAWGQVTKIKAEDGAMWDSFGESVSLSGNTLVVGASRVDSAIGSAYIFNRDQGGAGVWGQVTKITADDGAQGDCLGRSVSINGDTVVVGADGDDDNGYESGSAYIFYRDQGGADVWGQVTKITPDDGAAHDNFGPSVSISGDTVLVGADMDDDNGGNSGSVYVFYRDQGGIDAWGQVAKITADDGVASDYFGRSVSINGNTVVAYAQGNNDNGLHSESAYVFYRDQAGTDAWGQVTKITADDGAAGDYFGRSVSIDGNTVVVGALYEDDNATDSGSAFIFSRNGGGLDEWGQRAQIMADDSEAEDYFGRSVSVSGDTVVVGADHADDYYSSNSGSVYVYYPNHAGYWGQVRKIKPYSVETDDWFGYSVSISGDWLAVGAHHDDDNGSDSGSAYVFYRDQGEEDWWGQVATITADDGSTNDFFGSCVSISGDKLVVGAYGDDDNGTDSGSAYVFYRDHGGLDEWGQVAKITADDGTANDYFGRSVSISGDTVVVGAWGDYSGSGYIFFRDQGGADAWGQVAKIMADDRAAGDNFGRSVSISGDTVVVGASGDDDNGTNSGSAYVFSRGRGGANAWGQVTKITPDDGAAYDYFGRSVSISGNTLVVGAYGDDDNGESSGSTYVFKSMDNGMPWIPLLLLGE